MLDLIELILLIVICVRLFKFNNFIMFTQEFKISEERVQNANFYRNKKKNKDSSN